MRSWCSLSTVVALDVYQIAKGFRLLLIRVVVVVVTTIIMIIAVIVIAFPVAIIVARALVTVFPMSDFLAVGPAAVPRFLTAAVLEVSAVGMKFNQER